ncbi:MAG: hypothetical protein Q4G03_00660 [Planctomycetia bacterium]|nr:hypothetical protein [Planctomycetia bacterium]
MGSLNREEYVEQAYFFKTFRERLDDGYSSQEILHAMKNELLSATMLPVAVGVLLSEVKLSGKMSVAMARVPHYFTSFQTFVIRQAEREEGRFDFRIALEVLEREAQYRTSELYSAQGVFFFQFETISRNRLGFDYGLEAVSKDPVYDENWKNWINVVLRRQIGFVDIANLVYVRSEHYRLQEDEEPRPVLFGEKEGRIAHASAGRDPSFFFSALQRHLGYPAVPRHSIEELREDPATAELRRKIELLENRLQILQEELKGGLNLERFYVKE